MTSKTTKTIITTLTEMREKANIPPQAGEWISFIPSLEQIKWKALGVKAFV